MVKRRKVTRDTVERMKNLREIGLRESEIAEKLDLSYSTVHRYLKREDEAGFVDKLKRWLGLEYP